MIEAIGALLEGASFFGLFRLLSSLSTTEIVFIFLCSKPIFIFVAFLTGARAHLEGREARRKLSAERE